MRKVTYSAAVAVAVCAVLATLHAYGKSPAEQALAPIAKENKMYLLRPPRADVAPGDSYRRSDTQIIKRGCFAGDPIGGSVLRTSEKTVDYTRKAVLEADWLSALGLKVDYDRVGKVTLKLGSFNESGIVNIHPTFASHCLQEGYVRNDPIVASLVQISTIEADVFDKQNLKLGFDATSDVVKTMSEVTGKVQLERSDTSSAKIVAKDVFVMFRPFSPSTTEERFRLTCAFGTPCTTRKYGYSIRVQSPDGHSVTAVVNNPSLYPAMSKKVEGLNAGDATLLQEPPLRRDYIQVESVDAPRKKAVVVVSVTIFSLEAGPLAPASTMR
jgi:hypothetical protein